MAALFCVQAFAAHTSPTCSAKTATVPYGGSVVINITNCDPYVNFGFGNGAPIYGVAPTHGSALLAESGGNSSLTYTHNGTSGTTDTFDIEDADLFFVGFTITITPATSSIVVSPATLPTLTAGTPFSQMLSSTGGTAAYTYSLASGPLPLGVSLSAGGVVSGTPTQRGSYSFTVRSQDSLGAFANKSYSGSVVNPTLSLVPASATAIQGAAFSQSLSTAGGVAPHSYLLETGTFPAGITVSGPGVVSGTTAAAPGNYPVTLRVTDASTGPGSYFELEPFTLTVSPPPSVSIAVTPANVSEDGSTNLVFTVTRSLNLSSPTVVNITTSGTATSGTDYGGGVATLTIPAASTTTTITINPVADATVEPNETVILTVAAGTGYTVGAPASATGTILNDDVPTATIAVSPTGGVAEDGGTSLVYTVTLSQNAVTNTSVNFTVSGTATNGTDYATIASPVVIAAGSNSATITVNPTADATIETDETVVITLAAGSGYIVGTPASATGTILNDDLPNLTINDVTAAEGSAGTTNFTFTVSLSAPAGPGGVTFDISTANGTATAGVDYAANSLTGQTIPAGFSTHSFTVLVNGDTLNEPSETFLVNVTNVTGAVVVDGQGVGAIVDDDPLPSLSINDVTVVEGNSSAANAVFTVTLSAASGQTVNVSYATADGTATQPSDYTSTSGALTFTPGQTTRTITVPVIGELVPEANETFFVNLSGANNATISDNQGVGTITNDDVPVTVNPASVPNATVAAAYSQTLTASGGTAPYSFLVTPGSLPAGLTLTSGGVLSGTPTAGGSFNFTVTATDSSGFTGTRSYTLVVDPAIITLPATTLANGTLGVALTRAITAATGGTAPRTYAVTGGALPTSLTFNTNSGAISGTPSVLGTFNFTITATDSSTGTGPYTASRAYSMTIVNVPPVATDSTATVAYNAAATAVTLTLSGGAATAVAIGTAPTHGTAIATGTSITYQPTAGYAGPDSFTYTASNSGGTSAAATVSVTANDPVTSVTAGGGFAATVAVAYTQTFTFDGGASPWSGFAVTNLPAGLSINGSTANSVTIAGTPTQAGSFNISASATDNSTGNGPYSIGVVFTLTVAAPTLTLAPAAGTLTAPYAAAFSQSFTASGGIGPYTYAQTGALPPGLSFTGNTVSGTPTTPGSYNITVAATDTGATGTGAPFVRLQNYTIAVAAPTIVVNPSTLPNPSAGAAYSQTLTASGGVAPYGFAVSAGIPPSGITVGTGGAVSGTTNQVGTFTFTVTATDNNGQTGSRPYSVTVGAPTLTIIPASGPLTATFNAAFSQAFAATGSAGPFSYAIIGTVPPGLSLTGGTLSGTPSAAGSYPITIIATDTVITGVGAPFTVANNYTLTVNSASQTITFAPATPVVFGAGPVTLTASSTSGLTAFTYALAGGSTGCTLSGSTVTITGTGSCAITATQAGNANYSSANANATIVITPAAQTVTFAPATPVVFGVAPITLAASSTSGLTAFTYALGVGSSGCTVSGNSATITGGGSCVLVATQAGNANYNAGSSTATIVVNPATQTVTFAPTTPVVFGVAPIILTASSTSGLAAFSYALASGSTGCTLSGPGGSSATVTGAGSCAITATQAGNASYSAASATATIVINPAAQTVTFVVASPVLFGSAPVALAASASSGLIAFVFTTSSPTSVCTVAGAAVTFTGPGSCAITASQAGDANYNSASAVATIVVNATVPGAPLIGAATPGNALASVSFTAPTFTGGIPITSYTVSCTPGASAAVGAASPLVVTGLTNGTTYSCSVVASNAVGAGLASGAVSVTPSFRSYTGASATGNGNITASFTGGGAACSYGVSRFIPVSGGAGSPPSGTAPAGVSFPYGLFDFTTTGCTPGSTITMTVTYPGPVDAISQYWKYGPTPTNAAPNWYVLPAAVGQNSMTFTIADGGLGDDDLQANGTIVDQGGPGVPPLLPVPVMSNAALALMLLLMLGVAGATLRRGGRMHGEKR